MHNFDLNDVIFQCRKGLQNAAEKVGEAVEGSQLQFRKAQIKNELKEAYVALGQECYEMAETGQDRTTPMQEAMRRITKLRSELKMAEENRCRTETVKTCAACGTVNAPEFSYCCKCGHKI